MKFSRNKNLPGLAGLISVIAIAATVSLSPVFAQQIILDGNTKTNLNVNGNTTTVTTSTIQGNNAFNSFKRFNVNSGNTVNVEVPGSVDHLINLVHSEKSLLDGTLNFFQNGKIGGNVFFVNPYGITVGAQGVINVGSLTAVTPTQKFMNGFFTAPGKVDINALDDLVNGKAPLNPNAQFTNEGIINSGHKTNIFAGSVISYGDLNSCAVFDESDLSNIVNMNTIDKGVNMVNQNGEIKIVAEKDITVYGDIVANQKIPFNVDLHSKAGSIVVFNDMVGKVKAKADKGSIVIADTYKDLDIYKVKAQDDVFLLAMDNINDVNPDKNFAYGKYGEVENVIGNNIILMAMTGSAGNHQEDLNILANHQNAGGKVSAWAPDGHIFLEQRQGDMLINNMYTEKDLSIENEGSIIDGNNNSDTNIYGTNIALTSYSGSIGNVDSASNPANALEIESNISNTNGEVYAHALFGDVNLQQNQGDMKISHILAGKDVEIKAEGSIYGTAGGKTDITGDFITLTSQTGNIGTMANPITMNSSNNKIAAVYAYAAGDIALEEVQGTFEVGKIKAGNDVKLISKDSINNGMAQTGYNIVEGVDVELISYKGGIGKGYAPLFVHTIHNGTVSGGLSANAVGDIYIDSWEDLWLNTVETQGDVNMSSSKGIYSNKPKKINIKGADINLTAMQSIGTVANPIGVVTTTGNVNGNSAINDVHIAQYLQLNIPQPNPWQPEPIDLSKVQIQYKP